MKLDFEGLDNWDWKEVESCEDYLRRGKTRRLTWLCVIGHHVGVRGKEHGLFYGNVIIQ